MKNLKLLFMLVCIFTALSLPNKNIHAEENMKPIELNGDWVSNSLEDDVCFYKFTIPSSGTVTYTFQSYSNKGALCLKDETLVSTFSRIECDGSSSNPKSKATSHVLEQGTYVLKIYCYGVLSYQEFDWTGNYRLKVSFDPANNNETEPNDTFETAMILDENQQITGLISDSDATDFYKFTLDKAQTVTIIYRFDDRFTLSIWNSDFLPVDDSNSRETGSHIWEQYLQPGTYYIKVEDYDYSGTYKLKWQSLTYVSCIKLKKDMLTLNNGKAYDLLSTVEPSNATNKSLTWTSSNSSVASVDASGKVTAKGTGTATITATSQDGSEISASCIVIVPPKKEKITKLSYSSSSGRKIQVQFRGQAGASGYQVMYSSDKSFKKKKSTYIADYTNIVTGKLVKNKKYYFKVRAYYTYKGIGYYGAWSDVKEIRTKKI